MSSIRFACPNARCGQALSAAIEDGGRTVSCPKCGKYVRIPLPDEQPTPATKVTVSAGSENAAPETKPPRKTPPPKRRAQHPKPNSPSAEAADLKPPSETNAVNARYRAMRKRNLAAWFGNFAILLGGVLPALCYLALYWLPIPDDTMAFWYYLWPAACGVAMLSVAGATAIATVSVIKIRKGYEEHSAIAWPRITRAYLLATVGLAVTLIALSFFLAHARPKALAAWELARANMSRYNMVNIGRPVIAGFCVLRNITDRDHKPILSWRVRLLPHLGYSDLYERFHLDEPWDSPHNSSLISQMPIEYQTPGCEVLEPGKTCYLLPLGSVESQLRTVPERRANLLYLRDDLLNKIVLVEASPKRAVIWTKPEDLPLDPAGLLAGVGGHFEGLCHVLDATGAARSLPMDTPPEVLQRMFFIDDPKQIENQRTSDDVTKPNEAVETRPHSSLRQLLDE